MKMTMTASWAEPTVDNVSNGHCRTIASFADIDDLVSALSSPLAQEAIIYHDGRRLVANPLDPSGQEAPDHELAVAVNDGWGYMRIWTSDDDHLWMLDGDPASPEFVRGDSDFAAGSGLPIERVTAAIKEFFETARKPVAGIRWNREI